MDREKQDGIDGPGIAALMRFSAHAPGRAGLEQGIQNALALLDAEQHG